MSKSINTVAARARLADRAEPYWTRVIVGVYLGFRKTATASTWSIRYRDPATLKQKYKALGDYGTIPDAQRFDAAFREAQAFAQHLAVGGVAAPKTVAEACDAYVVHLRTTKSETAAADAARRFRQYVTDDARFAALELSKLTPPVMQAWRAGLASRPVHRSGRGKAPAVATDKQRSPSSLNRDVTPFRAALNHALEQQWVTGDFAWRSALKPIKDADKRREGYLDMGQRQALIDAAPAGLSDFVRVLAQLPVRPGALAALTVADFDPRLAQINIVLDKTGPRKITIPPHIAALFAQACRSKLPAAPIFGRPDGKPWDKDSWKYPFKTAAVAAGLPPGVVLYSLRHSGITDLVRGGLPLLIVAQLAGTSVRMIESNYAQHQADAATSALAAIAL
jgi:integrase